jgi:hypothetical protein
MPVSPPHLPTRRAPALQLLLSGIATLLFPFLFATVSARGASQTDDAAHVMEPDPILEALSRGLAERQAEALPPDWEARLKLEIAEVGEVSGTHALGRFNAPIRSGRMARLERRLSLPRRDGIGPVPLQLDIRITPRVLNARSVSIDLESRARRTGDDSPWLVRRTAEILREGRSTVLEAFQLSGSRRRLLLALSWSSITPDPLRELDTPHPTEMVDLILKLVREKEGSEETLRHELLSAGLGTEATRLIRMVGGLEHSDRAQHLEVRLHPQTIASGNLLLGVSVRGTLEAESEEDGASWVDHHESAKLAPGALFSLDLEGGVENAIYRLEIRPFF